MNFQANGKVSEIDGEVARRFVPAPDNSHQEQFKQALRNFIKEVAGIFGGQSVMNIIQNGTLDHGGGNFNLGMSVLNYKDAPISHEDAVNTENTESSSDLTSQIQKQLNKTQDHGEGEE